MMPTRGRVAHCKCETHSREKGMETGAIERMAFRPKRNQTHSILTRFDHSLLRQRAELDKISLFSWQYSRFALTLRQLK